MNNQFTQKLFVIFFLLVGSISLGLIASFFFFGNSLREKNIINTMPKVNTIVSPKSSNLDKQTETNIKKVESIPLKKVSDGVYTQQAGNVNRVEIKEDEIKWVEYTYNIKGREVKVKIPKGQPAPDVELLKKMQM